MNKHYQNGYFLSHFIPPQSKVFALLITFMLKYLANATMKLFQKKCRKGLLLLLFSFFKEQGASNERDVGPGKFYSRIIKS